MYVASDDVAAERIRASVGIDDSPRPEGAALRWYQSWSGDLSDVLTERMHPAARAVLADEQVRRCA
ncbi:hypothetical protein ACUN7V_02435 [Quadrisphaera oryzae]|uniref:hypothetical protein n=1 Tax=Quadrisphaera TaxID=317661 RepID=UPI00164568C6|nr:hypothetical protein [Quadrisphaera sp. RL12-1S]MBC3761074.1 hypothetical protein [Quadrisphaera sp. RL12-1S]